jgi:hypothetical protein
MHATVNLNIQCTFYFTFLHYFIVDYIAITINQSYLYFHLMPTLHLPNLQRVASQRSPPLTQAQKSQSPIKHDYSIVFRSLINFTKARLFLFLPT